MHTPTGQPDLQSLIETLFSADSMLIITTSHYGGGGCLCTQKPDEDITCLALSIFTLFL